MRLIVLQNEAMIADIVSGAEAIYVGSDTSCRVHLPDPRVAPRQVLVCPEQGGQWTLCSLDDTCLVKLNDMHVVEKVALKEGDQILLLEYAIRVYPDYEEKSPTRAAPGTTLAQLERFAASKLPVGATLKRADEPSTLSADQQATIARASVAVAGCDTIEQFMTAALQTLLTAFAAQRAWIGVRRVGYGPLEYVEGRLLTGQPMDLPPVGDDLKPRVLDRAQYVLVPVLAGGERLSLLCGPLVGPDGVLGLVYLDSGDTGRRFELRDLDFLTQMAQLLAHQLDAIFKFLARTRAALIEGQVSVTHEVQARLTPRMLPQSDALQWGAFREPGRERSGDIYDVVRVGKDLIAFFIARTPAAGAMPPLLLTQGLTAFRAAVMHQDPPGMFLRWLAWILFDGEKDHPLHCCTGTIDPATGRMQYALAGQMGAFVVSARGEERTLAPPDEAPALGLVKNVNYPLLETELQTDETLVLFTPGVTTARNRTGEVFGQDRFVDILCDGFGQAASATLKEMLTDLRNFTEGGSQPDDITVILAHRT